MSDIRNTLENGETVVATAQIHWWLRSQSWLILLLTWVLAYLLADDMHSRLLRILAPVVLGLGICTFLEQMLRYCSERAVVTSRRVLYRARLFSRFREMPLHCIEGVRIRQSVWARNLGYGSVRIVGAGSDVVDIPSVRDPVAFRAAIETARGI